MGWSCPKAQEWVWAWTVALAGARFASVDFPGAVYWQHRGTRITSSADAVTRSTDARQRILRWVLSQLEAQGEATPAPRAQAAQHLFRDTKFLARRGAWTDTARLIDSLSPGFVPEQTDVLTTALVRAFGLDRGVRASTRIADLARRGLPGEPADDAPG
ncbi:hypothetical protein, partial [Alienimonas sp. DA493]|uniref:hypothetical protein n=1 Tax=Alienimonas sp. DA493 TaxID=3373605 RepID=UPI0037541D71